MLGIAPDSKVLIVTGCENDMQASLLLQAGALGYLTKSARKAELIQAIRTVSRGQRSISAAIANVLAVQHLTGIGDSPFAGLSSREREVTGMLTGGTSVGAIAAQLGVSPKTVNSYRYRIFEKLKIRNNV